MGIDVAPKLDQELDDLQMPSADGVMQSRDAFVVRRARVRDLLRRLLHQLELALQTSVQQQRQGVKGDPPGQIGLPRRGFQVPLLPPNYALRLDAVDFYDLRLPVDELLALLLVLDVDDVERVDDVRILELLVAADDVVHVVGLLAVAVVLDVEDLRLLLVLLRLHKIRGNLGFREEEGRRHLNPAVDGHVDVGLGVAELGLFQERGLFQAEGSGLDGLELAAELGLRW